MLFGLWCFLSSGCGSLFVDRRCLVLFAIVRWVLLFVVGYSRVSLCVVCWLFVLVVDCCLFGVCRLVLPDFRVLLSAVCFVLLLSDACYWLMR